MDRHDTGHGQQERRQAGERCDSAGEAQVRVTVDEGGALRPLDEARRRRGCCGEGHRRHLEILPKIDLRCELAHGALARHDFRCRTSPCRQPGRQRFSPGRRRDRAEPLRDRTWSEEIQIPGRGLAGRGIGKGPDWEKVEAALEPGERLLVDLPPGRECALAPDDALMRGDETAESDRPGSAGDPGCQASGSQARDAEAAADEEDHEGGEPGPGDAQREGRRPPFRCRGGGRPLAIDRPGASARRSHSRTIARYLVRVFSRLDCWRPCLRGLPAGAALWQVLLRPEHRPRTVAAR